MTAAFEAPYPATFWKAWRPPIDAVATSAPLLAAKCGSVYFTPRRRRASSLQAGHRRLPAPSRRCAASRQRPTPPDCVPLSGNGFEKIFASTCSTVLGVCPNIVDSQDKLSFSTAWVAEEVVLPATSLRWTCGSISLGLFKTCVACAVPPLAGLINRLGMKTLVLCPSSEVTKAPSMTSVVVPRPAKP